MMVGKKVTGTKVTLPTQPLLNAIDRPAKYETTDETSQKKLAKQRPLSKPLKEPFKPF